MKTKLRFVVLGVICLVNIVNYMHFATIAIALVSMCDTMCESIVRKFPDFEDLRKVNRSVGGLEVLLSFEESHMEHDLMEYSGQVASVGLNWIRMTEEQMIHGHENGTTLAYCTWKELRKCKKFKLNHTVKALIYSSAFLSCLLFQLPFGIAVNKYGGFWFLLISTVGIGAIDIVLPATVRMNEWIVVFLRFLMGVGCAAYVPAQYKLIDEWLLSSEKSVAIAIIQAAQTIGRIIILAISGFMVEMFDWPSIMYVSSVFSGIVAISVCFIRDKPEQVFWMSQEELKIITADKAKAREQQKSAEEGDEETDEKAPIPWGKFFMNKSYASVLFFFFAGTWSFTIYNNEMPLFLDQMTDMPITLNGIINALSNVFRIGAILASGYLGESLVNSGRYERKGVRRFFGYALGFPQAITLILIPFLTSNTILLSIATLVAFFATGMANGSLIPLHYEMSSNYSVVLLSITDTVCYATGILVPFAVGIIQNMFANNVALAWQIIFVQSGILIFISTVVFSFCVDPARQSFDLAK